MSELQGLRGLYVSILGMSSANLVNSRADLLEQATVIPLPGLLVWTDVTHAL